MIKIYPANLDNTLDVQVMDHTYTIIEVATKLNLSDKTLRRWEEAGRFRPSRTLGNQRRYSLEDIQILDAIKHGTINSQSELLTLEQASSLCGVSPSTFSRWENEGKIHPLITSGNTYYPKQKVVSKLEEFSKMTKDPEHVERNSNLMATPTKLSPLPTPPKLSLPAFNLQPVFTNALITLLMLVVYHLIWGSSPTLISPKGNNSGSVQGVSAPTQADPRVDDLILKFKDHVAAQMLKDAKPIAPMTINLDNTSFISGSGILSKGKEAVTISNEKIKDNTPVTVSFTQDYSPAKKYWVTTTAGSFTLHTDFPLASDTSFNYNFLSSSPTEVSYSTPSAIIKP